jgi:hypothetical protein
MAQKVQVMLIDDIDGSTASETISFSLEGSSYEIDLNSSNAADLRAAFAPWIEAGRKASSRGSSRGRSATSGDVSKIRSWAKANGHAVSERGRIPASVRDAYNAAH